MIESQPDFAPDLLHRVYLEEARDALEVIDNALLGIGSGQADTATMDRVLRAAHSIKGGGATFGFEDIADTMHRVESLLVEVRDGRKTLSGDMLDQLLRDTARVRSLVEVGIQDSDHEQDHEQGQPPVSAPSVQGWRVLVSPHSGSALAGGGIARVIRQLEAFGSLSIGDPADGQAPDPLFRDCWDLHLYAEVDRQTIETLFAPFEDACDFVVMPLSETHAGPGLRAPGLPQGMRDRRKGDRRGGESAGEGGSIRVAAEALDGIAQLTAELRTTQILLGVFLEGSDSDSRSRAVESVVCLGRQVDELSERMTRLRMLPMSYVFDRLPRLVHDLGGRLGKRVEVRVAGERIRVDRLVLEQLIDPLVHLVRNSVDHGIESPLERRLAGKAEQGSVRLDAYTREGSLVVEIADDGRGLDQQKLLDNAMARGLIGEEAGLSDRAINELMMIPGVTTAAELSEVSGRGVGMDVVRRNIQGLGGTVEVESQRGAGCVIRIRVPGQLTSVKGRLARAAGLLYLIPACAILAEIPSPDRAIAGGLDQGVGFVWQGKRLRLFDLAGLMASDGPVEDPAVSRAVLVVYAGDGLFALLVDELLDTQRVIARMPEARFVRRAGLSGAALLADGDLAWILDVASLPHCADVGSLADASRCAELFAGLSSSTPIPSPAGASGQRREYLLFSLAGFSCALDTRHVVDADSPMALVGMPAAPVYLAGVCVLGASLVPILDLAPCLGGSGDAAQTRRALIVIRTESSATAAPSLALLADGPGESMRWSTADFTARSDGGSAGIGACASGVAEADDGRLWLLEPSLLARFVLGDAP